MRKLSLRAASALAVANYGPASVPVLAQLVAEAAANPGIDPRNYFSTWTDKNGVSAYRSDCRNTQKQWQRVKSALLEASAVGVTDAEIIAEAPHAYSGRWAWNGTSWHYTAGQYYCTEYRDAAATVIEYATRAKRQSLPKQKRTIATLADLIALNKANGGCWFDRSTMKFFGTRIESSIIQTSNGGGRFVTSEQPPHGKRGYCVRSFDEFGDVSTVGEVCQYPTKRQAMAKILANPTD